MCWLPDRRRDRRQHPHRSRSGSARRASRSSASPASSSCSWRCCRSPKASRRRWQASGDPRTAHRHARGPTREMTSGLGGDADAHHPGGARASRATAGRAAGVAGAVRHRRHPQEAIRHAANVPLRGIDARGVQGRTADVQDRRRADVRVRHERDHRRPRRGAAVRRARPSARR